MSVAETSHVAVRCDVIAAPLPYIVNAIAHRFPNTAPLSLTRSGLKEVAEID